MENGIFSRMVQRFRPGREQEGNGNGHSDVMIGDDAPPALVRASRRQRTELTLEKLQDGYDKVAGLVESLQGHLESQEHRTQQLVDAMAQLAGSVKDLPQETARQTEAMNNVAKVIQESAAHEARQGQQLAGVMRESDARVATTLDGLSTSVSALGNATHASTTALQKLHADAGERDERLAVLFTEQTRRFTIVFSFAITLAVIAAVIGVVALFR